jgi:short-subunit dehydrogenase
MHLSKVLITGATSGLGRALAFEFAAQGRHLLITGRNSEQLNLIASQIRETLSVECVPFSADLRKLDDINSLTSLAEEEGVETLINCAGLLCRGEPLLNNDEEYASDVISVNLLSPILLTLGLQSQVRQIININSICGLEFKRNRALYCSSKWGLRAFSECYKKEETGVKVLDVYPSKIAQGEGDFGLNIKEASRMIYNALVGQEKVLVLDDREVSL